MLLFYIFQLIFNTSDTYELMHCLEELTREDQITKRKENQPQVSVYICIVSRCKHIYLI